MAKKVAWWLTIMVLSRDVLLLVVAAVIILISGYRPFPPSLYGNLQRFSDVFVFAVVLAAAFPYNHWEEVNRVLIYTVTAFTVFSGFHYCFATARKLSS